MIEEFDYDFDSNMAAKIRKKIALLTIILYWPLVFFLTHTPMPKVVYKANLSDKSLHYMVYFILVFLLWTTIKPYTKVCWSKASVWIILSVVVWYGVLDEWLQGYVQGRTADVRDFFADLTGTLSSLIILTFLSFWPALLLTCGATIFVLVNSARADIFQMLPIGTALIIPMMFVGYTILTSFCIHSSKIIIFKPENKVVQGILTCLLPSGLLVIVKLGSVTLNRHLPIKWVLISGFAILLTALLGYLIEKMIGKYRKLSVSQVE